ncbi:hypothetical protein EON65_29500 [archaeon]|nr:MAG: hypothetical protein EON65_29500 [archaeon]
MEESREIRQSRKANIWKDTGDLTGLGHITDDLKLEEQLKVHMALKMMRRAYTKGSRVARAR